MLTDVVDAALTAEALEAQQLIVPCSTTGIESVVASLSSQVKAGGAKTAAPSVAYPSAMIPRSLQIDATLIDEAFFKVLRDQVLGALAGEGGSTGLSELDVFGDDQRDRESDDLVRSASSSPRESLLRSRLYTFFTETLPFWRSRYHEEITLGLRLLLFRLTIMSSPSLREGSLGGEGVHGSSIGDWMQNLMYRSEHAVRVAAVKAVQRHGPTMGILAEASRSMGTTISGPLPHAAASATLRSLPSYLTKALLASPLLLYISSFLSACLPSSVARRVLPSSASPISSVNHHIQGQALVYQRCYAPSLTQKVLLGVLTVLLPYAIEKLRQYVLRMRSGAAWEESPVVVFGLSQVDSDVREDRRRRREQWWADVLEKLEKIETIVSVLDLANTVIFFAQGRYRSLPERLLGLRMVNGMQKMQQFISFDLMNQQLSYGVTLNFFSLMSKLLRINQLASGVSSLGRGLASSAASSFLGIGQDSSDIDGGEVSSGGAAGGAAASYDRCGVCSRSPITLPRQSTTCSHVFCYYCITQLFVSVPETELEREGVPCPQCAVAIHEVKPLPKATGAPPGNAQTHA